MKKFLPALLLLFPFLLGAQDLMNLADSIAGPVSTKVFATFKTSRLVNAQSTETVKTGTLDFRITHRFGNIGEASGGGVHTLYGWDAIADVRLAFDFGITNNLTLGIARNKRFENIDGYIKYRFMEQTTDNKVPFSACIFSDAALTPMKEDQLYSGVDTSAAIGFRKKFSHRLSYTTQLILARKFGEKFSLELLPGYTHRNFVAQTDTLRTDENDIFSLGAGFRIKLTKRIAIIADYFQVFSAFRQNNPDYFAPLSIGIEIETGGHVFHLDFTNAPGIIENDFLVNTKDNWGRGGFKFGFNISRVFTLKH